KGTQGDVFLICHGPGRSLEPGAGKIDQLLVIALPQLLSSEWIARLELFDPVRNARGHRLVRPNVGSREFSTECRGPERGLQNYSSLIRTLTRLALPTRIIPSKVKAAARICGFNLQEQCSESRTGSLVSLRKGPTMRLHVVPFGILFLLAAMQAGA